MCQPTWLDQCVCSVGVANSNFLDTSSSLRALEGGVSLKNYALVPSVERLAEICELLLRGDSPIALDIETGYSGPNRAKASLNPETAFVVGISLTNSTDWARYVPLRHDHGENLDNYQAARLLWPVVASGRGVAHNFVFELEHLSRWFLKLLADDPDFGAAVVSSKGYFPIRSDTLVEAYLVADFQSFGLKSLVKSLFGHTMIELHELFDVSNKEQLKSMRFNILDLTPKVVAYACEDAVWCLAIHQLYYPKVKDIPLFRIERYIVAKVVPGMEDFGVQYDWAHLRRASETLHLFRDKFKAEIMAGLSELLGYPVEANLASPAQVSKLLYTQLGLRTTVYTKGSRNDPSSRKMSTGAVALARLAKRHPVVNKILQWREMTKLLGSYLDKYERAYGGAADGRTHPHHLSASVVTGRFSVTDPAYQQCGLGSYSVLTQVGWERLDELQDGTPVAQYHDGGEISFVIPERVVRNAYSGELIEFYTVDGDSWVWTPNHRMVCRWGRDPERDPIRENTAAEWEEFLARQDKDLSSVFFPQSGTRVGGYALSEAERADLRIVVDESLFALCAHASLILALCSEDLRWLVTEVFERHGGDALRITQDHSCHESLAIVQAAASLCGLTTSLRECSDLGLVSLHACDQTWGEAGRWKARRVSSPGMVYCVTVSTGMFLCRNDHGEVVVTGNSPGKYHFDLADASLTHAEHREAHGEKCGCDQFPVSADSCFKFNFRDAIIAPPDHYILGFDLSQAELRALAGEAQEQSLLRAFEDGVDVHSLTASLLCKVPFDQVDENDRQIGKAQPLDALVVTPSGWRKMGDLLVGDQVIGSDGHATKITGVFPQGEREVFRVSVSDGASMELCGEHLLTVRSVNAKIGGFVTKELRDLVASGLFVRSEVYPGKPSLRPKYRLPDRPVVQFEPGPELPINPYVLGLLLGAGGFDSPLTFRSSAAELLDVVCHSDLELVLTDLGLWGCQRHEKFVPAVYLVANPEDRLALLQGILDAIGDSANETSAAEFRSLSRALAEATLFLVWSLGGQATLFNFSQQLCGVYLRLPAGLCPFRIESKRVGGRAPRNQIYQAITEVVSVGLKQTQCIAVEAEDGLYLTGGFLPVHNTYNFAISYGISAKSIADQLDISVEEAQSFRDTYFNLYPAIAVWSSRQVRSGELNKFVTSKFGRKLPIWDYLREEPWAKSAGDRTCVNYPIQGCLPADTRVLTRSGWVAIGAFISGTEIWTGTEWASASRLYMGVSSRLRLFLSDGRTFDCDDRHRLLVREGQDNSQRWRLVTEAVGIPLCQDTNVNWGDAIGLEEDWRWVGWFVSQGRLVRDKAGFLTWSLFFNEYQGADAQRFCAWLDTRSIRYVNSSHGGGAVVGACLVGLELWAALGFRVGDRVGTLSVPRQVFRLDLVRREAFCQGYTESQSSGGDRLVSANRECLEDLLRLFQTIGRVGRIEDSSLGRDRVSHLVLGSRQELVILGYERLTTESMYTLSVDHPSHAFSSEGLISKNSATGDYMKIAMVRANEALLAAGLQEKVHLVMNLHDALEFYVHHSVHPQTALKVLQPAVVFPVSGWPTMVADWHVAKRWGSPVKVSLQPDGQLFGRRKDGTFINLSAVSENCLMGGLEPPESAAASGFEVFSASVSEDDPEPIPAVDSGLELMSSEFRPSVRDSPQVVIKLASLPSEAAYRNFKHLLERMPGPNIILLHTPEGELYLPWRSSLSREDVVTVSMILGPVEIICDENNVDFDKIIHGLDGLIS